MKKKIGDYLIETEDLFKECENEVYKVYSNEYVEKNRFLVSNMARCYDCKKKKFLNDYTHKSSDYNKWWMCDYEDSDSKLKCVPIHKAVAELFCSKPKTDERLVIDHKDGCKTNNLASNLRWVTYSENANAQDVQKRKAESIRKTTKYKNTLNAMADIITQLKAENEKLKEENEKLKAEFDEMKQKYSFQSQRLDAIYSKFLFNEKIKLKEIYDIAEKGYNEYIDYCRDFNKLNQTDRITDVLLKHS